MLSIIDDYSRKAFVYFLKNKFEVKDKLIEFVNFAEKQTGEVVKIFRSDNGTEYVNNDLNAFFQGKGIKH